MNSRTINNEGAVNLIKAIVDRTVKDFLATTPHSDKRKQIEREILSEHFETLTGLNGSELLKYLQDEYTKKHSKEGKRA